MEANVLHPLLCELKAALTYLEQGERAAVEAIPSIEKAVFATEDFKEGIQSFI